MQHPVAQPHAGRDHLVQRLPSPVQPEMPLFEIGHAPGDFPPTLREHRRLSVALGQLAIELLDRSLMA